VRLVTIAGTEYSLPVSMVMRATGQAKRVSFLSGIDGVVTDVGGRVVVDSEFRTGNDKIWAGGDCVNGGKEVVNAVAHGKAAARDIDRTLRPEIQRSEV
jgi:glutamate synthase (NADPH/NADH) small chain